MGNAVPAEQPCHGKFLMRFELRLPVMVALCLLTADRQGMETAWAMPGDSVFAEAQALVRRQKYAEAIPLLDQTIGQDPKNAAPEKLPEQEWDRIVMQTCSHEAGHALGLNGHSPNNQDVMFPLSTEISATHASARDRATILRLYASYPPR